MQTDEYVMLDKITRFRQDSRSEIVALFIKFSEKKRHLHPLTLVPLWNCAHERSLARVVSQRYCGSASCLENLTMQLGVKVFFCLLTYIGLDRQPPPL